MRNTILVALMVFIIVAVGGFTISWFVQASQFKKAVEQSIANLNGTQPLITYDAIESSGFPSDVIITIVKPHFAGRMDTILKNILPAGDPAAAALPAWTEELAMDGNIRLSINALSDRYLLTTNGNWHSHATIGNQEISVTSQATGDTACSLQLAHSGGFFSNLWNFRALIGENRDLSHDFRMLDCSMPAYTASDSKTQEVLISSGGARLYATHAPEGNAQQTRIYIKASDAEVTPAGDKIMASYLNALTPNAAYPSRFSNYGKQNFELDASYNGPTDWKAASQQDVPADINISKLVITNKMYSFDSTFHFAHSLINNNRMATLNFATHAAFTTEYDALMQQMAQNFVTQLYSNASTPNPNPQFAALQPVLQKYKPEELYAIIAPVIPQLHSLGNIAEQIDASYQGDPNFSQGDANLSNLELSTTSYGITAKGTAKLAGQAIPAFNISLTCRNCAQLVDDTTNYAGRLQKVMALFNPAQATMLNTDPRVVDAAKNFLSALGVPDAADKTTYSYTIVNDAAGGMSVNGKPLPEVMGLYMQYMGPVLQQPAAAPAAPH